MSKTTFTTIEANKNLKGLTLQEAQKWVKIATEDFERRLKLGGTQGTSKALAMRKANQEMIGRRPYER